MEADEKAKQSALPPPLQRPSCAKSAPAAPPARDVSGQVVFGLLGRLLDPQQARSEQRVEILRQLSAEIARVTATASDRHCECEDDSYSDEDDHSPHEQQHEKGHGSEKAAQREKGHGSGSEKPYDPRGKSIPLRRRSRCPTPRRGKSIPPRSSRHAEKPGQRPVLVVPLQPKTAGAPKTKAAKDKPAAQASTTRSSTEQVAKRSKGFPLTRFARNTPSPQSPLATPKPKGTSSEKKDHRTEKDKEDHAAGEKDHGDKKGHAADKRDHKDHGDKRGRERDERNERDEVVEDEFEADFSSLDEPGGAPRPSPMGRTRLRGRQVLQPISI